MIRYSPLGTFWTNVGCNEDCPPNGTAERPSRGMLDTSSFSLVWPRARFRRFLSCLFRRFSLCLFSLVVFVFVGSPCVCFVGSPVCPLSYVPLMSVFDGDGEYTPRAGFRITGERATPNNIWGSLQSDARPTMSVGHASWEDPWGGSPGLGGDKIIQCSCP